MSESSTYEEIAPGVTGEWSADRQFLIFHMIDCKRPTLDAWATAMKAIVSTPDGPVYMIYHFLEAPSPLTVPYMERKFKEISDIAVVPSGGRVYLAAVIPSQFISIVRGMAILQQSLAPKKLMVTTDVFATLNEALTWIASKRK